jgi:metal-responsive CopG/Arc/MetJ family transcriptional regulator
MTVRPSLADSVAEALDEHKDEYDLPSRGEAVRHLLLQEGYDV